MPDYSMMAFDDECKSKRQYTPFLPVTVRFINNDNWVGYSMATLAFVASVHRRELPSKRSLLKPTIKWSKKKLVLKTRHW